MGVDRNRRPKKHKRNSETRPRGERAERRDKQSAWRGGRDTTTFTAWLMKMESGDKKRYGNGAEQPSRAIITIDVDATL